MSRRRPVSLLFHVVALCAVALLNVAVVRSSVMQAAPEAMAHCADMPGMSSSAAPAGKPAKADSKAGCAFCAAAAHAPVTTQVAELATPTAVSWRPLLQWSARGPRGPPPVRPTARGPPPLPMI